MKTTDRLKAFGNTLLIRGLTAKHNLTCRAKAVLKDGKKSFNKVVEKGTILIEENPEKFGWGLVGAGVLISIALGAQAGYLSKGKALTLGAWDRFQGPLYRFGKKLAHK